MADFDLEFKYPHGWTLVATGKPTPVSSAAAKANGERTNAQPVNAQQSSRWVSERPIPSGGIQSGQIQVATAQAGDVTVETYATPGWSETSRLLRLR